MFAYFLKFLLIFLAFTFKAQASTLISWVDKQTGHKVVQLSSVPYSMTPYFSVNAYSSDQKYFFYISPLGIHRLNLSTFDSELLVESKGGQLWLIGAAHKSNRIFYLIKKSNDSTSELRFWDIEKNNTTLIRTLPIGFRVETINADDTLAAGVFEESEQAQEATRTESKGEKLYRRAKEKIFSRLFTIDLRQGDIHTIYRSMEWLSHPQFSPTDPTLMMYSIEGPWHLVDRIWTIKKDGSQRKLIHRRTVDMEIVGHEFWSADGNTVLYDWQRPKGEKFFVGEYDVTSGERKAYPLQAAEWSIHFNSSSNANLFVGDGADRSQVARSDDGAYIRLYKKTAKNKIVQNRSSVENLEVMPLVDMRAHDYQLEPNARISPNNEWVIFRSNMFGAPAIFGVQTAKSNESDEKFSTLELAEKKRMEYRSMLISE